MIRGPGRHRPWAPATAAAGVAVAAMAVLLGGALRTPNPAGARDRVVASSPAEASALTGAPTEIALTGSSAPDPARSHMAVRDGAGHFVDDLAPLGRRGDVLWRPVSITTAGEFSVSYHVVFQNGGEAVGVLHFSVAAGPASPARGRAAPPAPAHEHGGVDPVGAVLLLADVVVLVGVIVLVLRKPRPRVMVELGEHT